MHKYWTLYEGQLVLVQKSSFFALAKPLELFKSFRVYDGNIRFFFFSWFGIGWGKNLETHDKTNPHKKQNPKQTKTEQPKNRDFLSMQLFFRDTLCSGIMLSSRKITKNQNYDVLFKGKQIPERLIVQQEWKKAVSLTNKLSGFEMPLKFLLPQKHDPLLEVK